MKVQMKQFEVWCGEFAERWNKPSMWEFYCLVKDSWLNGYNKAKEESLSLVNYNQKESIKNLGNDSVEVEMVSNQIGQGKDLSFNKDFFKADLRRHYSCEDLKVNIENGTVSFQGTFKI